MNLQNQIDELVEFLESIDCYESLPFGSELLRCRELLKKHRAIKEQKQKSKNCEHEWLVNSYDHFGFAIDEFCEKCDAKRFIGEIEE